MPREWQDSVEIHVAFVMVAPFLVTTWSLQRASQMEHKDMLHATDRLKIAICYRNKRHLPLRDRCP
jgi:hypothetical protein